LMFQEAILIMVAGIGGGAAAVYRGVSASLRKPRGWSPEIRRLKFGQQKTLAPGALARGFLISVRHAFAKRPSQR